MLIANMADIHNQGGEKLHVVGAAFSEAMRECGKRGVDIVNLAGDLFEDPCFALGRDTQAGDVIRAAAEPILDFLAGKYHSTGQQKRVNIVSGNHDDPGPGHATALEVFKGVPGITIIDSIVGDRLPFHFSSSENISIAFLPWEWNAKILADNPEALNLSPEDYILWMLKHRRSRLESIRNIWGDTRSFKMIVGHAEIDGAVNRYKALPPGSHHVYHIDELRDTGANHLAFGHYHKRQMDCYIGSLIQLNHGEESNPVGFQIVDSANGSVEWVDVECPRYYTINASQYINDLPEHDDFNYSEDYDHVKIRDTAENLALIHGSLPRFVRKEALPSSAQVRVREGIDKVTQDTTPLELLKMWIDANRLENDFGEKLASLLEEFPLSAGDEAHGSFELLREITLSNFGPFGEEPVSIKPAPAGLIAIIGRTGSGKTHLLEACFAVLFNCFPFYPGTIYDSVRRGFKGRAEISIKFVAAGGREFHAVRRVKMPERKQEAFLWEFIGSVKKALANGSEGSFSREITSLIGSKEQFLATVFRSQHDTGSLVKLKPQDRMELMRSMIGASQFEDSHERAKERVKVLQGETSAREARARTLQAAQCSAVGVWLWRSLEDRVEMIKVEIGLLQGSLVELEAERERLRSEIARAPDSDKRRQELSETISRMLTKSQKFSDRIDEYTEEINNNLAAIGGLTDLTIKLASRDRLRVELEETQEAERQAAVFQGKVRAAELELQIAQTAVEQARKAMIDDIESRREAYVFEIASKRSLIDNELSIINRDARATSRELTELETKAELLDRAGCKAQGFLTCAFIDDARRTASKERIEELNQALHEYARIVKEGDFAHGAREELAIAEAEAKDIKHRRHLKDALAQAEAVWSERKDDVAKAFTKGGKAAPKRSSTAITLELNSLADIEIKIDRIQRLAEELPKKHEFVADMKFERLNVVSQWKDAKKELELLEQGVSGEVHEMFSAIETKIKSHREELASAQREVGSTSAELKASLDAVNELDGLNSELASSRESIAELTSISQFFGPSGAPQILIDTALPRINTILSELLSNVNSEYGIVISTQRENKSGTVKEGLFINITDGFGNICDILETSGGEQNLYREFIRLAFGAYNAERSGAHHGVMFIDEPTIGLDFNNLVPQLLDIFVSLTDRFNQIIFIEHNPLFIAGAQMKVLVERPHNGLASVSIV